jgi:hypothetical protein
MFDYDPRGLGINLDKYKSLEVKEKTIIWKAVFNFFMASSLYHKIPFNKTLELAKIEFLKDENYEFLEFLKEFETIYAPTRLEKE